MSAYLLLAVDAPTPWDSTTSLRRSHSSPESPDDRRGTDLPFGGRQVTVGPSHIQSTHAADPRGVASGVPALESPSRQAEAHGRHPHGSQNRAL